MFRRAMTFSAMLLLAGAAVFMTAGSVQARGGRHDALDGQVGLAGLLPRRQPPDERLARKADGPNWKTAGTSGGRAGVIG